MAVGQKWVTPKQFWQLHPIEFWLLVDAHKPVRMYGKLTEYEVEELYEEVTEHQQRKKSLERLNKSVVSLNVEIM